MTRWTAHNPGFRKGFGFAVAAIALVTGIVNTTQVRAQLQPVPPQFEVASIKPNKSADLGGTWRVAPGGRFTGENIPLKFLLTTAYHLKESQISGIPSGWTESEKYDIIAKGEGNPTQEQMIAMLQGLLADRFKLKRSPSDKGNARIRTGYREEWDQTPGVEGWELCRSRCGDPPVARGQRPPDFCGTFSREEVR